MNLKTFCQSFQNKINGEIKIGQAEVVHFLEKCTKPKTRKQIAEAIECDPVRISHILKDLLRWKEIKFIEYDREKASTLVGYVLLRRTKFYYTSKSNRAN